MEGLNLDDPDDFRRTALLLQKMFVGKDGGEREKPKPRPKEASRARSEQEEETSGVQGTFSTLAITIGGFIALASFFVMHYFYDHSIAKHVV
jgi:hypothetical protein